MCMYALMQADLWGSESSPQASLEKINLDLSNRSPYLCGVKQPNPDSMTHSSTPLMSRKLSAMIELAETFGLDHVTSCGEFYELTATEQLVVLESL